MDRRVLISCGADARERAREFPLADFGERNHMEWSMKKSLRSSGGQIAVLYAGILVTLIGAIALGTDVAAMYVNWQQVRKAADAGALAGAAQFLPTAPAFTNPAAGCPSSPPAPQAACLHLCSE